MPNLTNKTCCQKCAGMTGLRTPGMDKCWNEKCPCHSSPVDNSLGGTSGGEGKIVKIFEAYNDYICYNSECSVRSFDTNAGNITSDLPFTIQYKGNK